MRQTSKKTMLVKSVMTNSSKSLILFAVASAGLRLLVASPLTIR